MARRVCLLALLLAGAACGERLAAVPGSTCSTDSDCDDYTSCAFRPGACECLDSQCYLHPDGSDGDGDEASRATHIDGVVQGGGGGGSQPPGWSDPDQHGSDFEDGGPADCATAACHGVNLDGGASGVSCDSCHSGWKTDCTFCHGGTDNPTGAPPEAVHGATARTDPRVGAHTAHVEQTSKHAAWDCGQCHVKPSSALSPGHIAGDGAAEVVFSSLNPAASYSAGSGSCSSLYCHGNGRTNGGSGTWPSTASLGCASCHDDGTGASTLSGKHYKHIGEGVACYRCHNAVVNSSKVIIGLSKHVDGAVDVDFSGAGTYSPATGRCSSLSCHGSEDW